MKVTGMLEHLINKAANIHADNIRKDVKIAMLADEEERLKKEIAAIKGYKND